MQIEKYVVGSPTQLNLQLTTATRPVSLIRGVGPGLRINLKMFKYAGFDSYDSYVKKSSDVSSYEKKKEAAR